MQNTATELEENEKTSSYQLKEMLVDSIQTKDIEFTSSTTGIIKNINKDLIRPFIKDALIFLAQEKGVDEKVYFETMSPIDLRITKSAGDDITLKLDGTIFDVTYRLKNEALWNKILFSYALYQSRKVENRNMDHITHIINENESEDWHLAQKLFLKKEDGGVGEKALLDMFGTAKAEDILSLYNRTDLMSIIKNYETDIQPDDIVRTTMGKQGLVIWVKNTEVRIMHKDFSFQTYHSCEITKTGRKSPLSLEIKFLEA